MIDSADVGSTRQVPSGGVDASADEVTNGGSVGPRCVDAVETSDAGGGAGVATREVGEQTLAASGGDAAVVTETFDGETNLLGTGPLGVCEPEGWCWQTPAPFGTLLSAMSDDGRFVGAHNGIVIELPDKHLPVIGEGFVKHVQGSPVGLFAVADGEGLVVFDGQTWEHVPDVSAALLTRAPSGQLWTLGTSVHYLDDDTWAELDLPEPLLDATAEWRPTDLVAPEHDVAWLLAERAGWEKAPATEGAQVTLFEHRDGAWTRHDAPVELAGDSEWRFGRVQGKTLVYPVRLHGGVYDPADAWSVVAVKDGGGEMFEAPDGRLLVAAHDGLRTLDGQLVSAQTCSKVQAAASGEQYCLVSGGGFVPLDLERSEPDAPVQLDLTLFDEVPPSIWAGGKPAWGSSETDIWRAPLQHFDGVAWTEHAAPSPEFATRCIDGSSPENVWFASRDTVLRFDGRAFEELPLPSRDSRFSWFVSSLRTFGPSDSWLVYASTEETFVLHYDGEAWRESLQLRGGYAYAQSRLAGPSSDDLWAALDVGLFHHTDGGWREE